MHEYAICERILEAVLEAYARVEPAPSRLKSVRVVAGCLHQLVPEYLEAAYELLSRETPAEGSVMEVVSPPVTAGCRACGWEGPVEPPLFQCAACGAFDLEVRGGQELYLEALEVETP